MQNPCFSPDGSQLLITIWHGGYNRAPAGLYSAPTSGGALTTVLNDGASNVNLPGACWNNGRIVFASDSVGTTDEIWTSAADGSNRVRVTNHTGPSYIEPSFSPDGKQIVFELANDDNSAEIWKINADGTGLTKLSSGGNDRQPNWSPAGDKILFQRHTTEWAIYTMSPDGSGVERITPAGLSSTDASFSPDGRRIVFSASSESTPGANIAVMPLTGGTPTFVTQTSGYNGAPSWSPDGQRIAFETSNDPNAGTPTSIYLANAPSDPASGTRGFASLSPWVSFYGSASQMGDLAKVADTFRIINIDADPDAKNFTPDQIKTLKAGGKNRVISYINIGACESFRSYWTSAPAGMLSCSANTAARIGPYAGYADETWMNLGNADYQRLILDHVAPRLVAQGVDGFFLDNMELVTHDTSTSNGPCDANCAQGGLDLVRKLRERYPDLLIVMQNATSDVTRLGTTGGIPFPSLLDGISHEEVFVPFSEEVESELLAWKSLGLRPGGRSFFIGTEDYVGSCTNTSQASDVYTKSRADGFSPYVTDASAGQRVVCYWGQ